jgi:hypothetical protein
VDAPEDLVERLLVLGEFAALGLLDRVAEAGADVLVAEVGQGGGAQGGGESVEGVDWLSGRLRKSFGLASDDGLRATNRVAVRHSLQLPFEEPPEEQSV